MKIYVGFQDNSNKSELISSLKKWSSSNGCNFVFSTKSNSEVEPFDPKECIKTCDIMLADVSSPTIPLGIEIGWADIFGLDIICACSKGTAISSHLTRMSKEIIIYTDYNDLSDKLEWMLENKYTYKNPQ